MVVPGSARADGTRVHSTKLNEHEDHGAGTRTKAGQCCRPVGNRYWHGWVAQCHGTALREGIASSLLQWPESGDGNTYDGTGVYGV